MIAGDVEQNRDMRTEGFYPLKLEAADFSNDEISRLRGAGVFDQRIPDVAADKHLFPGLRQNFTQQGGGGGFPVGARYSDDGRADKTVSQFNLAENRNLPLLRRRQKGMAGGNPRRRHHQIHGVQRRFVVASDGKP
jgi:hypothetical protein